MAELSACLTEICARLETPYAGLPIPSIFDSEISECLRLCIPVDANSMMSVARTLSVPVVDMLLGFSERMATYSLRTGDQGAFDDGLLSLRIAYDGQVVDWREVVLEVALYLDVVGRAGLSLESSLSLGGKFADLLKAIPKDRRIEDMGYVVDHEHPDGAAYRRTWPTPYRRGD